MHLTPPCVMGLVAFTCSSALPLLCFMPPRGGFQEAFGPQLQALESRLQQEISRKAKEVEGKVVGLQHDLEGEWVGETDSAQAGEARGLDSKQGTPRWCSR